MAQTTLPGPIRKHEDLLKLIDIAMQVLLHICAKGVANELQMATKVISHRRVCHTHLCDAAVCVSSSSTTTDALEPRSTADISLQVSVDIYEILGDIITSVLHLKFSGTVPRCLPLSLRTCISK